ncbi:hypothetical protein [Nocardia sp. CA-119907]|uniref:hypothetical protein n=1 Tax=Nocardia sp. CA-119907 TaxID=3239973 RepID=UPI003D95CA11
MFSNTGGQQTIRIVTGSQTPTSGPRRNWGWWLLFGLLVVDVGYFFYGKAAYTGGESDSGDLWRALTFIAMVLGTLVVLRQCVRSLFADHKPRIKRATRRTSSLFRRFPTPHVRQAIPLVTMVVLLGAVATAQYIAMRSVGPAIFLCAMVGLVCAALAASRQMNT